MKAFKIKINDADITRRNSEHGHLRSTGAMRVRVVRDRTKYTRKVKHCKGVA